MSILHPLSPEERRKHKAIEKKMREFENSQHNTIFNQEYYMVVTSMHSSVISDDVRQKYFEQLDAVQQSFPQNCTQRMVDGVLFIKHPTSGEWMLKCEDKTYTRHRHLDHLPHFQAALDLAVKEMKRSRLLDFAVGGIAMQFIVNDDGDKVLINKMKTVSSRF